MSNKGSIRNKIILGVLGFTVSILLISVACFFISKKKYQNLSNFYREVEIRAAARRGRPNAVTNVVMIDPAE